MRKMITMTACISLSANLQKSGLLEYLSVDDIITYLFHGAESFLRN